MTAAIASRPPAESGSFRLGKSILAEAIFNLVRVV
jgi:hypothetical protein